MHNRRMGLQVCAAQPQHPTTTLQKALSRLAPTCHKLWSAFDWIAEQVMLVSLLAAFSSIWDTRINTVPLSGGGLRPACGTHCACKRLMSQEVAATRYSACVVLGLSLAYTLVLRPCSSSPSLCCRS